MQHVEIKVAALLPLRKQIHRTSQILEILGQGLTRKVARVLSLVRIQQKNRQRSGCPEVRNFPQEAVTIKLTRRALPLFSFFLNVSARLI